MNFFLNIIGYKEFLKQYDIEFEEPKDSINWMKRLKPQVIIRIGKSFFVEEDEMKVLLEKHLDEKIKLRDLQRKNASKNFFHRKKKPLKKPVTGEK